MHSRVHSTQAPSLHACAFTSRMRCNGTAFCDWTQKKKNLYLGRFLRKARVKKKTWREGATVWQTKLFPVIAMWHYTVYWSLRKNEWSEAVLLSMLQNGIFGKGALRFSFCYLHIITKTYYFDRTMEILRTKQVKCSERVSLYASV